MPPLNGPNPTSSALPRPAPAAVYLGIDPGASGGLAVIAADAVTAEPMPATERDIWQWFHWYEPGQRPVAVLEKVGGYVGEAQPGSAAFKFGASYGMLKMALIAAGIPFEEVTPQTWQKALGIPPRRKGKRAKRLKATKDGPKELYSDRLEGGESKTQWKNRLKAFAQKLFPGAAVTLKTADALLLAEYCRRKREGTL